MFKFNFEDLEEHKGIAQQLSIIVLVLSVLSVLLIVWAGYDLINHIDVVSKFFSNDFSVQSFKSPVLWDIFFVLIGISSQGILFTFRVKIRHITDFDENGLSKNFNSYDKLSRKEKDEIDKQKLMEAERILDTNKLRKMTKRGAKDPNKELEKLIGLEDVKKEMKKMASKMEYEQTYGNKTKNKKKKKGEDAISMHMCFLGPPGTGKTTCARIMAGFLYKYGYIRQNKCIEVDGNFLKGVNPGETSMKVSLIIQHSMGGVLFIDEAYSLLSGGGNQSQEAIASIIKSMEDNRDDLVIILAGYEKEMKDLINANPGFFSRIKHYMWFANYSDEELRNIFNSMANSKNYYVPIETLDKFSQKMKKEMKKRNFGNARTVRNCLEKAIDTHAYNMMNGDYEEDCAYTLMPNDIEMNTKEDEIFNSI